MADKIDKLLDQCYNEHSHEGEFDVQGWKIIVFRKADEYADCGAFVFKDQIKYFTGWFEQGEDDLIEVMKDAVEYMFEHGFSVAVKVSGELDEDALEGSRGIRTLVMKDCLAALENLSDADVKSLQVTVDPKNETFSATFTGKKWTFNAVKNEESFFSGIEPEGCSDFSVEMVFVDEDVAEFAENAFSTHQSWY